MDTIFTNCPRCATCLRNIRFPVTLIAYPEDYNDLFDLFEAKHLVRTCPFCGLEFFFGDPIIIYKKGVGPLLIIVFEELSHDELESYAKHFPGASVVNDPVEIVACLFKLIENDKTALDQILSAFFIAQGDSGSGWSDSVAP